MGCVCGAVAGVADVTIQAMTQEISIPTGCSLHPIAHTANFADAFATLVPRSSLSAIQIYAAIARDTPGWVEALMAVLNRVVQVVGLKNLGQLAAVPDVPAGAEHLLQRGTRLGLFSLVSATPDELVMEDADKHLTVQLSVLKQSVDDRHDRITLSTVVHVKNNLGRLYMLPVGPLHKLIAPAVMRRAPAAVARTIAQAQTAATI
jgi:Protein of unknown function (DUF2867)